MDKRMFYGYSAKDRITIFENIHGSGCAALMAGC